jgi:hypothetical protein
MQIHGRRKRIQLSRNLLPQNRTSGQEVDNRLDCCSVVKVVDDHAGRKLPIYDETALV